MTSSTDIFFNCSCGRKTQGTPTTRFLQMLLKSDEAFIASQSALFDFARHLAIEAKGAYMGAKFKMNVMNHMPYQQWLCSHFDMCNQRGCQRINGHLKRMFYPL